MAGSAAARRRQLSVLVAKDRGKPSTINNFVYCPCTQNFAGSAVEGFTGLERAHPVFHPEAHHCICCECEPHLNSRPGPAVLLYFHDKLITGGMAARMPDRHSPCIGLHIGGTTMHWFDEMTTFLDYHFTGGYKPFVNPKTGMPVLKKL